MLDTTETKIFLADTYALVELLGGNLNYKPYLNHVLITTKFNLIELYYHLLQDYGKETADKYLNLYLLSESTTSALSTTITKFLTPV